MTISSWPQSLDRNTGLVNLNLAQNKKFRGCNMPKKNESAKLRAAVLKIIVYSDGVVTCEEIKENLSEQKFSSYSEYDLMKAINSILAKRKDQLEFTIVTRGDKKKSEFAIKITKKFWY
jgi:hypothetical protein